MGHGYHNDSCAKAKGRACACRGCGGSQHGFRGWFDYVAASDTRRHKRRAELDAAQRKPRPPRAIRKPQELVVDIARLDVADWLARQHATTRSRATATAFDGGRAIDSRTEPQAPTSDAASSEDGSGTDEDHNAQRPATPSGSVAEQVECLADQIANAVWQDISAEIGYTEQAEAAKKQLAHHGWCDLFVGMARAMTTTQRLLNVIPGWTSKAVKRAILESSIQERRPALTEAVVDMVVNKVWNAFKGVIMANNPLFAFFTGDEAARAFRILALFMCPAPERHAEVRHHALKPLGEDARSMLADETKQRLAELFANVRSGRVVPG